jgi:predicted ATPase
MSHPILIEIAKNMRDSSSENKIKSSWSINEQGNYRISFLKQHRFVGRKVELQQLNDCFHRIKMNQKSELVLLYGPPGVGKSSLVRNFAQNLPTTTLRVEGKFEQRRTHIPYAAFVSASDQLCRQISRQDNCDDIRERIRSLLGPEVNLLGNLVPKLSEIIYQEERKDHTAVNTATGSNAFTRFKLLFRAFLRCVARPQNPLVFFLDDLQWADTASLEVLSSIVTDAMSQNMLLICAYREDELPTEIIEKYIFSDRQKQVKSIPTESSTFSNGKISTISIPMLDSPTLNKVISEILSLEEKDTESLSSLVVAKTDGNPFYALSFLDMLYTSGLLRRENDSFWIWDEINILRQTNVADNLASILESKLLQYPDQVRSILQIASFIGNDFSAFILATIVYEEQDMIASEYSFDRKSRDIVQERIQKALKFAIDDGILETVPDSHAFKFAHDKIQHVLYEDFMPDETERQLLHYRIGTILKNNLSSSAESGFEQSIFLAANNMNRALNVIDYSLERYNVIELNLKAAKLAINKAAFLTAVDYLRIALKLLEGDSSWKTHYDLCMDLHSTAAEVENIVGCHEKCTELISKIQKRAKCLQHAAVAYEIQINSLANQYNIKEAVSLGLDVLRKIGVNIPRKVTVISILKELLRAKLALGRRSLDDLLYLPELTDQWAITALRLMNCVIMKAFLLGDRFKEIFAVLCLRMFRITIRYGVSGMHAPISFLAWGSIHAVFGMFDVGIHSEQLAFSIIDKMKAEAIRGQTMIMSYSVTHLWRHQLDQACRQDLINAYHQAMSYGDIFRAQFGMVGWVLLGTYLDSNLMEIHNRMRTAVAEMREYDAKCSLIFLLPTWQSVSKSLIISLN